METLEQKIKTGKGFADRFLPDPEYDIKTEAEKLIKYKDLKEYNITKEAAYKYLDQAYEANKGLLRYAKIADKTDRITSKIGVLVEGIGALFGGVGAIPANAIEEGIEMGFKAPFLAKLYKRPEHRKKLYGILGREAATFAVPVLGDLYDIYTDLYIKTAKDVIRDDAKKMLLQQYKAPAMA
jgi:hypothetical protein